VGRFEPHAGLGEDFDVAVDGAPGDAELAAAIDHQARVLFDAAGAGLAAPQIGRLRRIVVYCLAEDPDEPFFRALVNPEIVVASSAREEFEEGCLGMPGLYVAVERAAAVTVRAFDVAGEPFEIDAEGRHASLLQHEIDHLDGILIPDRLPRAERRRYLAELRTGTPVGPPAPTAGPPGR